MFEVFDHTADLGLRIKAASLEELLADAGRGLFSLIVESLEDVALSTPVELAVSGVDPEYLLFDWLNELLFVFESKRMLLGRFTVRLVEGGLEAVAWGEPADPARHRLDHEVKAITYHGLKVAREGEEWRAEVIVDI